MERLRRILGDARSKKDADSGTVRFDHQTSSESNPGSAHVSHPPRLCSVDSWFHYHAVDGDQLAW